MPRRPRLVTSGVPLHIIERGNNRQHCFYAEVDYLVYLDMLATAIDLSKCCVHAYVLMSTHVHALVTPSDTFGAARMMRSVGERYVRYFNKKYERTGTLWDGRYRSCLVHEESYLMVCYRYVELNPVRAGMVADPALYRWSSYRANALSESDDIVRPHPLYDAMGHDARQRQKSYRDLVGEAIAEDQFALLRDATNNNYACGSLRFRRDMAKVTGQSVERIRNLSP